MGADILFMERGCSHCGVIKAVLDMETVERDDFEGPDGQEFHVISSQSNKASLELLRRFELSKYSIPVLLKHDGDIIHKPSRILEYLKQSGIAVD